MTFASYYYCFNYCNNSIIKNDKNIFYIKYVTQYNLKLMCMQALHAFYNFKKKQKNINQINLKQTYLILLFKKNLLRIT